MAKLERFAVLTVVILLWVGLIIPICLILLAEIIKWLS